MASAAAARHCSSWADLMPELVGLVLRRLPSLADRVRLGAVCRPWRRVARQEPDALPPPLPWLTLLDGTFLSVPGGEVHRMPHVPEGASLHGAAGNWLFLERRRGRHGGELALMDLFSERVERLPVQACVFPRDPMFLKLAPLCSTLDHHLSPEPDSLFAVLRTAETLESIIFVCNCTRRPSAVTALRMRNHIFDIAFFDGKLYALSLKMLVTFEIVSSGYQGKGKPRISSRKHVAKAVKDPGIVYRSFADKTYVAAYWSYLAESDGKLLLVRRLIGALSFVSSV